MNAINTPDMAEGSLGDRRWTMESKLDLPLWVKLQHAQPQQFFNVLLTLEGPVTPELIDQIESAGVELSDFHREQPSSPLPGKIAKADLTQEDLLQISQIKHIEGVLSSV